MSKPDDIPENVMRAAQAVVNASHQPGAEKALLVARAIIAEGERIAVSCLSKRYTEEQGMDAEMDAYNAGLEEAAKIARRSTP